MYVIALALAFATTIKPAAAPFFWLFVLVVLAFRIAPWRRVIGPVALYAGLMLGWSALYWANSPARVTPLTGQCDQASFPAWLVANPLAPVLGPPNAYVGYHFLMKFYRYREYLEIGQRGARDWLVKERQRDNLLDPSYGPAVRQVHADLERFTQVWPQHMQVPAACMREFQEDGERFMAWLHDPAWHSKACSGSAMGWIFNWLQLMHGEEAAGRLMLRAGMEIAAAHPSARLILLGDLAQALAMPSGETKPSSDFRDLRRATEAQLMDSIQAGAVNLLPEAMKPWVGSVPPRNELQQTISAALEWQYETFRAFKPMLFVLMVACSILAWRLAGNEMRVFLVLAAVGSASIWVVAMIMPDSDPRHENVWSFFPLLVIGLCAPPRS